MIILNAVGFQQQQSRGAPRLFANTMVVAKARLQNYYGFMDDSSSNGPFGSMTPIGQYPNGPNWAQNYAFSSGSYYCDAFGVGEQKRFVFPDGSPITTLRNWWSTLGPGLDDDAGLVDQVWQDGSRYANLARPDLYAYLSTNVGTSVGIYIEGVN